MAPPAPPAPQPDASRWLRKHCSALGRAIGAREAEHVDALAQAFGEARRLHAALTDGLSALHAALDAAGSSHLRVSLGEPRLDEKHVRAVQFELVRGRTVALVSVKSRGDVVLVGPFRSGKTEGPCAKVPFVDPAAVDEALAAFLERFLDEAMTP